MEFNYQIETKDQVIMVSMEGELMEKFQVKNMLDELDIRIKETNKIILNLEHLKYINSVGLNIMINVLTKFRSAGGEVIVCCLSKKVRDLFLITKLNSVFIVLETLTEAKEYFHPAKE